jgi:hypothetical protein
MAETRRKFDGDFKHRADWASTKARWETGAPRTGGSVVNPAARSMTVSGPSLRAIKFAAT